MGEIALIGAVLLLVVGTDDLPYVMRWIGRKYAELRRMADEMRRALVLEADRMDADLRLDELKQRRAKAEAERERAKQAGGVPREQALAGVPAEPQAAEGEAEAAVEPAGEPERRFLPPAPPVNEPGPAPAGIADEDWAEMPEAVRAAMREQEGA